MLVISGKATPTGNPVSGPPSTSVLAIIGIVYIAQHKDCLFINKICRCSVVENV